MPIFANRFLAADQATEITLDGNTAFAIRSYYVEAPTLYSFDIDNTAPFDPPNQVGTLPLTGENVDVAVAGDLVLVANERGGAFVVETSDPSRPRTLSRIDVNGARSGVPSWFPTLSSVTASKAATPASGEPLRPRSV